MNLSYPFEFNTDISTFEKNKDNITTLYNILKSIMEENEDYQRFVNSISITNRDSHLRITAWKQICTSQMELDPIEDPTSSFVNESIDINRHTNYINFMNFGMVQFKQFFRNNDNDNRYQAFNDLSLKIFKPSISNSNSYNEMFYNVLPSFKGAGGSHSNVNDAMGIIAEISCERYNYKLSNVLEILVCGKTNTIVGVILNNGITFIKWSVINSAIKKSEDMAKELLTGIFKRSSYILDRLNSVNISSIDTDQLDRCMFNRMYKVLCRSLTDEFSFFPARIAKENSFRIEDVITEQSINAMKNAYDGTVYNITKDSMYKKLLLDCFVNFKKQLTIATKEAYKQGMNLSNKLSMLGWSTIEPRYVPGGGTENDAWFVKRIDLVPDRYSKGGNVYKIAEKNRTYKVEKLYLSSSGSVRSDCEHPNVHGMTKSVCTGDMERIDFSWDAVKIKDWLSRLESLLSMMNFDSPYYASIYTKVSKDAELMTALSTKSTESAKIVKSSSGMRKLGSAQNQVEEEAIIVSSSNSISINSPDQPNAEAIVLFNDNGVRYDNQEFQTQEPVDMFDDYNVLLASLRSTNRTGVSSFDLARSTHKLQYKIPRSAEGVVGIYIKDNDTVIYFYKQSYYRGYVITFDEFKRMLRYCRINDSENSLVTNKAIFYKFVDVEVAQILGIPSPVPLAPIQPPIVETANIIGPIINTNTPESTTGNIVSTNISESTTTNA